jgi:hypothetical protein
MAKAETIEFEIKIKPKDLKRIEKNADKLAKQIVKTVASISALSCALQNLSEATKGFGNLSGNEDGSDEFA